jgi:hypothetical protein
VLCLKFTNGIDPLPLTEAKEYHRATDMFVRNEIENQREIARVNSAAPWNEQCRYRSTEKNREGEERTRMLAGLTTTVVCPAAKEALLGRVIRKSRKCLRAIELTIGERAIT